MRMAVVAGAVFAVTLATPLWLAVARDRDAAVSPGRFLAIALLMAPADVTAAPLVLAAGGWATAAAPTSTCIPG